MTDNEIIKLLGGGTEFAKLLAAYTGQKVDREAVYKWGERGFIPYKWRPHVYAILKKQPAGSPGRLAADDGFLTRSPPQQEEVANG